MNWIRLMIITGTITLVNAAAYWYASSTFTHSYNEQLCRFFFPDSPTTAWFLTPEERVKAVQRIKVSVPASPECSTATPTLLPSRKIKRVWRTSISRSSSEFPLSISTSKTLIPYDQDSGKQSTTRRHGSSQYWRRSTTSQLV